MQGAGNLAIQHLLKYGVIQAKLTIGPSGDAYEIEADRVAEQMLSGAPAQTIQRKCAACSQGATCSKCEEEKIQAKGKDGDTPRVVSGLSAQIGSLRGGGQPLPSSLRNFFEPRFGRGFGDVRIHTGPPAESASAINARAFTLGNDVVFAPGEYSPETRSGKKLLAHEPAHVVQQRGAETVIQRQPQVDPNTPCRFIGVELPHRIYFTGTLGSLSARLMTSVPPGDYRLTYDPSEERWVVAGTLVREEFSISAPSDPELFETYRKSVTRQSTPMHVAGGISEDKRVAMVPDSSITPDYVNALSDTELYNHADVYRTRLPFLATGPDYDSTLNNLNIIQSEQLRRQSSQIQIVGQVGRPLGLPIDGSFVLQPAGDNDLSPDILANVPDGRIITLSEGLNPAEGGTGVRAAADYTGIVSIQALDENLEPFDPSKTVTQCPVRPTDVTDPLAAAGLAANRSINAGLLQSGFQAAAPDAIGLVGVPRWFTPGSRIPESIGDYWGHTALYVRRAGQVQIVRGLSPQIGGDVLSFIRNYRAIESGAAGVPAVVGNDAYLFTLTGSQSIEYPVTPAAADALVQRLPPPGPATLGSGVPTEWTARPAAYKVCTQSNCVLWATSEAEAALGGLIGPAEQGVSVTSLAGEAGVVERTASQGRLINFMRGVEQGEQAIAPAMATGPPVVSGMPRGLQVLKWGGRAFFVIGVLTVPWEIFSAPPDQRARVAVGAGAGFIGGFLGGMAAGLVCGPGAPICSIALGLVFGIAGALGLRKLAEGIFDAAKELKKSPGSLFVPTVGTATVFRGGLRGLLRTPMDMAREYKRPINYEEEVCKAPFTE